MSGRSVLVLAIVIFFLYVAATGRLSIVKDVITSPAGTVTVFPYPKGIRPVPKKKP